MILAIRQLKHCNHQSQTIPRVTERDRRRANKEPQKQASSNSRAVRFTRRRLALITGPCKPAIIFYFLFLSFAYASILCLILL